MSYIQSVVFHRDEITLKQAKDFLRRHGFKDGVPDITKNTYRFRQREPQENVRYRTKPFPGGMFVLAYKE